MEESEQPIICGNIARQSFDLERLSTEAACKDASWKQATPSG